MSGFDLLELKVLVTLFVRCLVLGCSADTCCLVLALLLRLFLGLRLLLRLGRRRNRWMDG